MSLLEQLQDQRLRGFRLAVPLLTLHSTLLTGEISWEMGICVPPRVLGTPLPTEPTELD